MVRRRVVPLALLALSLLAPPSWAGEPAVHRVSPGQTLGRIARRYGVSVDALCHANAIDRSDKIKPGQKLLVPPRSDRDGSRTRALHDARARAAGKPEKPRAGGGGATRWHTVRKGQRLGSIARRYGLSVEALCQANDIDERAIIKPGQKLAIPAPDDADGARARAARRAAEETEKLGVPVDGEPRSRTWRRYARPPRKKGLVSIARGTQRFEGYLIDARGRVLSKAKKELASLLATRGGEQTAMNERLLTLLAQVSDTFGGRRIEIVSGYRRERATAGSRHRHGRAIDFRIAGVPNTALRDYLQTLDRVGIGYYPRSSFVHLDVREQWTYWVDHSGPGEPARYGGFWTRPAK